MPRVRRGRDIAGKRLTSTCLSLMIQGKSVFGPVCLKMCHTVCRAWDRLGPSFRFPVHSEPGGCPSTTSFWGGAGCQGSSSLHLQVIPLVQSTPASWPSPWQESELHTIGARVAQSVKNFILSNWLLTKVSFVGGPHYPRINNAARVRSHPQTHTIGLNLLETGTNVS